MKINHYSSQNSLGSQSIDIVKNNSITAGVTVTVQGYNTSNAEFIATQSNPTTGGNTVIALGNSATFISNGGIGNGTISTWDEIELNTAAGSGTIGAGWNLTGNAGTTAGTNFIGTTDANDLVVKTGGSASTNEKLRVLNSSYTVVVGSGEGTTTANPGTLRAPTASDCGKVNTVLTVPVYTM